MRFKEFKTRNGSLLSFSEITLGTSPLGDLFSKLDEVAAQETVRAAYLAGVRAFDTSPHYGNGLAEARIGAALRNKPRNDLVISTKVGRWMDPVTPASERRPSAFSRFAGGFPHRAQFDYSYDGTMRSIEQSLLRTGFGHFDILLIHDCDVWTHGPDADQRFKEAMNGAYKALDKLRADGRVKAIGVGLNEVDMSERFARAGDFDVMMLSRGYSLLEQPALQSFLPLAEAKGIGILLAGVFNSGILAKGAVAGARYDYAPAPDDILARVREIEATCKIYRLSIRQAALRFATFHPAVVSVVLGASTAEQIKSNVAEFDVNIPQALWSDLKAKGLVARGAPTA